MKLVDFGILDFKDSLSDYTMIYSNTIEPWRSLSERGITLRRRSCIHEGIKVCIKKRPGLKPCGVPLLLFTYGWHKKVMLF